MERSLAASQARSHGAVDYTAGGRNPAEIPKNSYFDFCLSFQSRTNSIIKMSSRRGTSRVFGRRGSSWRGKESRSRAENPQPPMRPQPLGPTIDSINSKILLIEEDAPTIQDVEYVASYNWLDGKSPIILVPGR
jgi:hypothetical protein